MQSRRLQREEGSLSAPFWRTSFFNLALGAIWILDGLLQLQPYMFSRSFEIQVVRSAAMSLPTPINAWFLTVISAHMVPYAKLLNVVFCSIELVTGVLLLLRKKFLVIAGNVLSAVWGFLIWVFGEGFGGTLTLSVVHLNLSYPETLFTGFPGAALLYALISVFILVSFKKRFLKEASRLTAILIFGVGALIQLLPQFFDPRVQFSMFVSSVLMGSAPHSLVPYIVKLASWASFHPVVANMAEIMASLSIAFTLILNKKAVIPLSAVYLAFVWVFGMGFMGLFNGVATDPGTPPLLFVLVLCATLAR